MYVIISIRGGYNGKNIKRIYISYVSNRKTKNRKNGKNSKIAKKIYDASWYELIRCIEYKSKWKDKKFYQVETNYPSSQLCSHCSYQNKKVKNLSLRAWECPKCSCYNDRDINASINIMGEGIKKYMEELEFN